MESSWNIVGDIMEKKMSANIQQGYYQLYINTDEKDLRGMHSNWSIGINNDSYFHESSSRFDDKRF